MCNVRGRSPREGRLSLDFAGEYWVRWLPPALSKVHAAANTHIEANVVGAKGILRIEKTFEIVDQTPAVVWSRQGKILTF